MRGFKKKTLLKMLDVFQKDKTAALCLPKPVGLQNIYTMQVRYHAKCESYCERMLSPMRKKNIWYALLRFGLYLNLETGNYFYCKDFYRDFLKVHSKRPWRKPDAAHLRKKKEQETPGMLSNTGKTMWRMA